MKIKNNKSVILDRIKFHYSIQSNAELARFLGISPSTLSNWYSRNTIDYDLVFSKCKNLDLDWLINGVSENPQFENISNDNLDEAEKKRYEDSESALPTNLSNDDWKDINGYCGFISAILKKNDVFGIDSSYDDIRTEISLMSDILEHYSINSRMKKHYQDFKQNKIDLNTLLKNFRDEFQIEKDLYRIIVPLRKTLNKVYSNVDKFNEEHDRLYVFDIPAGNDDLDLVCNDEQ